jgi:hypothetical protein
MAAPIPQSATSRFDVILGMGSVANSGPPRHDADTDWCIPRLSDSVADDSRQPRCQYASARRVRSYQEVTFCGVGVPRYGNVFSRLSWGFSPVGGTLP